MSIVGSVSVDLKCDICDETLRIGSRTQMKTELDRVRDSHARFPEGYHHVCKACETKLYEERHERYVQNERAHDLEVKKLKALSYSDYLNTDFWKSQYFDQINIRKSIFGQVAKLNCELCLTEAELSLRHKSQKAVARESFENTILVCKECDRILARESKIYFELG